MRQLKEIDLAAYPIPLAWDDDCPSMLQFTFPIETDEFYLMQKWPTEKTRLTAMISPFSHPVGYTEIMKLLEIQLPKIVVGLD